MESLSSIWHVGMGMIVGLARTLGAWSAASRGDRRGDAHGHRRDPDAVTSPRHRTVHTAPTPKG
jgi:hypothetical protein